MTPLLLTFAVPTVKQSVQQKWHDSGGYLSDLWAVILLDHGDYIVVQAGFMRIMSHDGYMLQGRVGAGDGFASKKLYQLCISGGALLHQLL